MICERALRNPIGTVVLTLMLASLAMAAESAPPAVDVLSAS